MFLSFDRDINQIIAPLKLFSSFGAMYFWQPIIQRLADECQIVAKVDRFQSSRPMRNRLTLLIAVQADWKTFAYCPPSLYFLRLCHRPHEQLLKLPRRIRELEHID